MSIVLRLLVGVLGLAWCSLATAEPEVVDGEIRTKGDAWLAGPSGATLQLAPNSVVHLMANSSLSHRKADVWFPKVGRVRCHVLALRKGSLEVRTSDDEPVVVRSGALSIASLGGEFATGTKAAVALSGKAWVRKGSAWRWLPEGERVLVTADGRVTSIGRSLPAPEIEPTRLLVTSNGHATLNSLVWSDVAGARSYTVTLRRDDINREVVRRDTANPTSMTPLATLVPGRYTAQVRAVDESGLPGASARTEVTVVGVVGTGVVSGSDGVFSLPPKTDLHLSYVQGLEMSLDDSTTWFPAVPSLRLREEGLSVLLRYPGTRLVTRVDVRVREQSVVDVRIGPKTAIWPEDVVTAQVQLDGLPADAARRVRVEASIGSAPVLLSWRREGRLLTATVPRPQEAGPWVVRVVVFDADGTELGRGHLEIACAPTSPCGQGPEERHASRRDLRP